MKTHPSPGKVIGWSLAVLALTYFGFEMATLLRAVGTERVNRRTKVSIESPQLTLELLLPKGMWQVHIVEEDESIQGVFKLDGDMHLVREHSNTASGVVFHTDRDFTRVIVRSKFEGEFKDKFLEIRAVF